MPTPRESVRARRNVVYNRAKEVGIDLSDERSRSGSNQRALALAAKKLINEGAPRQDAGRLTVDDPPTGAFDGANTTYNLSGSVAGHQLAVIWGDVAGARTLALARSTDNPPPADAFFFDFNVPDTVIVGTPPQGADALIVVYQSRE